MSGRFKHAVAWLIEAADEWCHDHLPRAYSPRWLCDSADVCYGGPCDGSWPCPLIHEWLYGPSSAVPAEGETA